MRDDLKDVPYEERVRMCAARWKVIQDMGGEATQAVMDALSEEYDVSTVKLAEPPRGGGVVDTDDGGVRTFGIF